MMRILISSGLGIRRVVRRSISGWLIFGWSPGQAWLLKWLDVHIGFMYKITTMVRFFLRRLIVIPLALVLVHFACFAFAHVTGQLQQSQTIFGSGKEGFTPVWPEYSAYLRGVLRGDFGQMPVGVDEPLHASLWKASLASLGLLGLTFLVSLAAGLGLGLASVRVDPPRYAPWLSAVSTLGLALPSFYIGALLISGIIYRSLTTEAEPALPVSGYGWDLHLLLPMLALAIRPAVQIAQVTGSLLSGELGKRYVVAARSFGLTWEVIRRDKALRNVLAPIIIAIAGAFRVLAAELVLIEWLFDWPGIGRLLALTLVPPMLSGLGGLMHTSAYFLYPPLVAALLVVFALLFLLADMLASGLARLVDPRLRVTEEELPYE